MSNYSNSIEIIDFNDQSFNENFFNSRSLVVDSTSDIVNVSNNRGLVIDTTINIGNFANNVDIDKCLFHTSQYLISENTYKNTLVFCEDIHNAFQLFEIETKHLLFDDMR